MCSKSNSIFILCREFEGLELVASSSMSAWVLNDKSHTLLKIQHCLHLLSFALSHVQYKFFSAWIGDVQRIYHRLPVGGLSN